jgi:hypothetical protein
MSETEGKRIHGSSEGGVAGIHELVAPLQFLAGPATSQEFNTARLRLIPIACWRVDDLRFVFDSSFVLPGIKKETRLLARLIRDHTEADPKNKSGNVPPIAIFGHADPTGKDDYNKVLSGRRAAAIYGMLTRRDEVWEDLYSNGGAFAKSVSGDQWGVRSVQSMLNALGIRVSVDGEMGPETRNAVQQFQTQNGLAVDGNAGPATRKKLFLAYMDQVSVDSAGKPFAVDKIEGFLARNSDAAGKGDFQGCGEFNPLLILSEQDQTEFDSSEDKTARNEANAPNRRVMVLLFRPGSRVVASKWPCPRAKEGTTGCVKRFWSDGEKRRSTRLPDQPREFELTADTFACRFYQRLLSSSPCEQALKSFAVRLYDGFGLAIPFAPFAVAIDGGDFSDPDEADDRGIITLRDLQAPATVKIKWGFQPDPGQEPDLLFDRSIFVIADNDRTKQAAVKKLSNLGYDGSDASENVIGFQLDYGHLADPPLAVTGTLDKQSADLLERIYQQTADDLRQTTTE